MKKIEGKNKMKEIVKQEKQEVQVAKLSPLAMMAHSEFKGSNVNLTIPRLLVKNAKSPHLDQYKHIKDGDIVETLNYEVVASLGEKVQFIPFSSKTVWLVTHETKNGSEFQGVVPFDGERLAYEEEIDKNTTLRRSLGIQVMMLKVDDIANDIAIPYTFTFKSSSTVAGKKLNTIMYVSNRMANRAPWSSIVEIFSVEKQHPKGNYYSIDLSQFTERGASEKEQQVAEYWFGKMVANAITVDISTGEVTE